MENKYTSLKLSKLLHDNGCKLETKYVWAENHYLIERIKVQGKHQVLQNGKVVPLKAYSAYDILNDICVRYAKEFFLESAEMDYPGTEGNVITWCYRVHTRQILRLLQQNKKQKAEDYIWENCLFNPKNK